jgi:hypothetical protein
MKRGWITWDKTELPPSAFESRLAAVRKHLAATDLPALVVYTDIWKSNQGRYLSNFMPYWNRALLVIPCDGAPVLLCGLSPRVYPWIRSVTILDEIRPSPNIAQQLTKMCEEKAWKKIGVLDLPQLPYDLSIPNSFDVPWSAIHPEPDEAELAMYRRAAEMARKGVRRIYPGLVDHELVGRLEREYRRAGAEDLVILVTNGDTPPLPPKGSILGPSFSVSVAMEYRGHWAKIVKTVQQFSGNSSELRTELLSGAYPYECCRRSDLKPGSIFAAVTESMIDGNRIFTGDSYRQGPNGPELL